MIAHILNYRQLAADKLNKEYEKFEGDRYEVRLKEKVLNALLDFIKQDNEFAQAVKQGGNFADCMKAVKNGIKDNYISDIDAYREAVKFYFPGADIFFNMTIELNPHDKNSTETAPAAPENDSAKIASKSALSLSLDDLF